MKENKEKNNFIKDNKKIIIIGVIVWIVAIAGTVAISLLLNNKGNKSTTEEPKQEEKQESNIPKENIYIASYFDTYDNNDIEIKEYKLDKYTTYVQLNGLKDEKFQRKINEEIHDKVVALVNKLKNNVSYEVSADVEFNANNILSISINGEYETKKSKYNYATLADSINYNLTTQEKLELKDLFNDEKKMYSMLSQELAKSYALQYSALHGNEKLNTNKVADLEDRVFKAIQDIKNIDYNFYVNNSVIYILVNEIYQRLSIYDYMKELTYLKKYKYDASIYNGKYKGLKNTHIFSLARGENDLYKVEYDTTNKNLLYDIYVSSDSQIDDVIHKNSKVYDYIDKYAKSADKNKFTYLAVNGYVTYYKKYDYYEYVYMIDLCSTDLNNKDNMLKEIYKLHHVTSKNWGTYAQPSAIFIDKKKYTCKDKTFYLSINKNGIITIDTLFKKDYDYKSVIKNKFIEKYSNSDNSNLEELEEIWNNTTMKIELYLYDEPRIDIYIGDYDLSIELSEFDKDAINL